MAFWRFWAMRHILRANCAEIIRDKPEQPAYEIFSIKRIDVNGPSHNPLCSKRPANKGIKEGCLFKMRTFVLSNLLRSLANVNAKLQIHVFIIIFVLNVDCYDRRAWIGLQWFFIHAPLSRVPFALAGLSCLLQ